MGKTYNKQSKKFEDEFTSGRAGKHVKHSNNRKNGGMRTLNSYADEEEYDGFDDDIELEDEIFIQHIQNDTN